jgi:NAD-dependent SIR2 family protein deacetylase
LPEASAVRRHLQGLPDASEACIPTLELPRCKVLGCNGLLRPDVVWFGENLDHDVMERADAALTRCDVLLVVGTSAVVYVSAAGLLRCAHPRSMGRLGVPTVCLAGRHSRLSTFDRSLY